MTYLVVNDLYSSKNTILKIVCKQKIKIEIYRPKTTSLTFSAEDKTNRKFWFMN